jgi:hypothetical protein
LVALYGTTVGAASLLRHPAAALLSDPLWFDAELDRV